MKWALRIYQSLAQAFPHEFKMVYGDDVMRLGSDAIDDIARTRGIIGLVRLVVDIALRLFLEYTSEIQRDARYACRALLKSPGFALVGIVSIGIGIGLTTMLYRSKWQMLSRELPGATNAERLVMPEKPASYEDVEHYREQSQLFAGVAAFQTAIRFNVMQPDDPTARPLRVFGQLVSPDYFRVLGVRAQAGRVLSADIDKAGDAPVVVISDRFWRDRLNASPNAIGKTLRLNNQLAVIVGITPRDFDGALPLTQSELFVPITVPSTLAPELGNNVLHDGKAKDFLAIMRLQPGVTLEQAEAALDATIRHIDERTRPASTRDDTGRRITLLAAGMMVPVPRGVKPAIMGFFIVLMALIMTIACMNLANMLLARGANRRRELAIRLAVGASRARLVRQMVTEGILLSLLGGVAGVALAYGLAVARARLTVPTSFGPETPAGVDWHAASFAFVLAIVCGIGFSLTPALRVTRADITPALKQGSALQLPGFGRLSLRNVLMGAQLTGALTLLLLTGFLVLGFGESSSIHTNVDPRTVYLASVDPIRDGYTPNETRAFFRNLPRRLEAIGAVQAVALASKPPFPVEDEDAVVQVASEDARRPSRNQIGVFEETIGSGYFATLKEPLRVGGEFNDLDDRRTSVGSARLPVVLNESAARGLFGDDNVIGNHLRDEKRAYEVIGVIRDLKRDAASRSVIYLPLTEQDYARPGADGLTIIIRAEAGRDALQGLRREVALIDPRLTVFDERTLNDYLDRSRSAERFAVDTYGAIGLFGLVLAAVGLAGVTAYSVAQRRREIGIRIALGARRGQVLRLVLREGAVLVVIGTLCGLLGAFALARMLSTLADVFVNSLHFGASDLSLIVGAPLLLAAVALVACYIPARRAARIDPIIALRQG